MPQFPPLVGALIIAFLAVLVYAVLFAHYRRRTMPKPADAVLYNDGTNEDQFALVAAVHVDGNIDLYAPNGNNVLELVASVPRREKKDYGPEGGGRTWHT